MHRKYLVWLDMEMTGLDSKVDKVLEIATVVTDSNLDVVGVGPAIAVFQEEEILKNMGEWCQKQHHKSGLINRVRRSKISVSEAEKRTLGFLKNFVDQGEAPLCGSSIHQDRYFLLRYMPTLNDYLFYRNIDVSSIKELYERWFPALPNFKKKHKHTAMEDVHESIAELKYYRNKIFANNMDVASHAS